MSIQACAEMVHQGDPDRFLSAMTAAPDQRSGLFVLYAFNLEVSRAPWVTQEPLIAQMRLQWWADAIEEIYSGELPRRHEVVTPLAEIITQNGLDRALFDQIIETRRQDIGFFEFADRAALMAYLDGTSGALMQAAADYLCPTGRVRLDVSAFGGAVGLANFLRAVPVLLEAGKDPLPDMTITADMRKGDVSKEVLGELQDLAAFGLAHLRNCRKSLGTSGSNATPALRSGAQSARILGYFMKNPAAILTNGFVESEIRRRSRMIWLSVTDRF